MQSQLHELGTKLVEDSRLTEEFSARGAVEELFPYIYSASRRMSARAISRWLTNNGVKISDVTIGKALREPEKYAEAYVCEYEPAGRIFAEAYELDVLEVMTNRDLFEAMTLQSPLISASDDEEAYEEIKKVERAKECLKEWFNLNEDFRRFCLPLISDGKGEDDRESD